MISFCPGGGQAPPGRPGWVRGGACLLITTTTTTTTNNNNDNNNNANDNNNNNDNDRPLRQLINRRLANFPFGFYRLPNEGAKGVPRNGGRKKTTGSIVFYTLFFTCSSPHVDRRSKPLPWARLLPLILI